MLGGHLDSAAWAKAMASFRAFMHAINIGARSGASVENIMSVPTTLSIRRPDDWHVHLRDGPMLAACAVHTARQVARGIIMPNRVPPATKVAEAVSYRERIRRALPAWPQCRPRTA